jgi:hypothetical protein
MFDPNLPANFTPLASAEMRAQLNGLKDLIDAIQTITAAQMDAVNTMPPGNPTAVKDLKVRWEKSATWICKMPSAARATTATAWERWAWCDDQLVVIDLHELHALLVVVAAFELGVGVAAAGLDVDFDAGVELEDGGDALFGLGEVFLGDFEAGFQGLALLFLNAGAVLAEIGRWCRDL